MVDNDKFSNQPDTSCLEHGGRIFDQYEIKTAFRKRMDAEQQEIEDTIRKMVCDFENKSGRVIYFKPTGPVSVKFTLDHFSMGYTMANQAILDFRTNPQLYY